MEVMAASGGGQEGGREKDGVRGKEGREGGGKICSNVVVMKG